jgi:hypothetical protein
MRGTKRGLWRDYKSGAGGNLLDLIALEVMGLTKPYGADFPKVLAEAAKWAGVTTDTPIDSTHLDERRAKREQDDKAADAAQAATRQTLVARFADMVWPVKHSPAVDYLASRGITRLPSFGLGYLGALAPTKGIAGHAHPSLVVWGYDANGKKVGGQRILITPDGSKAALTEGEPRKPMFAASGVARFPELVEGPLCVCEGPESALSVWQATGFETWAVFGVSGWGSAALPRDRQIILCPDRDAPVGMYPDGSHDAKTKESAARAFTKALAGHLSNGLNIWIAEAPEPVGSKADLNDTLQHAGNDAVAQAITDAVDARPPPIPPVAV